MDNSEVIKSLNSIEFHLKSAESEFERIKSALSKKQRVTSKKQNENPFLEHLIKTGKIIRQ